MDHHLSQQSISHQHTNSPTTLYDNSKKRFYTSGASKIYVPSFFSEDDCIVGLQNYDAYDQQPLLTPDEVVISTKNLIFEVYNGENHLLSSLKYTLRVCTVNCGLSNMWVQVELVCGMTNTPIICVKNERKGKRGIKGRCCQDLDVSKHGYTKAKLEFRFRETSSDQTVDKFRLNVNIYNDSALLLTFKSPRFRTVVRSPQRGKNKQHVPKDVISYYENRELQQTQIENEKKRLTSAISTPLQQPPSQQHSISTNTNNSALQWHNFKRNYK